jgi:NAD(P)H-dependent flavin oxidoreductase YrpB (nitropropane dioxygenase family)
LGSQNKGRLEAMWSDRRVTELLGIEHPILLAPMAGPGTMELVVAVAEAGGLGALPCAIGKRNGCSARKLRAFF